KYNIIHPDLTKEEVDENDKVFLESIEKVMGPLDGDGKLILKSPGSSPDKIIGFDKLNDSVEYNLLKEEFNKIKESQLKIAKKEIEEEFNKIKESQLKIAKEQLKSFDEAAKKFEAEDNTKPYIDIIDETSQPVFDKDALLKQGINPIDGKVAKKFTPEEKALMQARGDAYYATQAEEEDSEKNKDILKYEIKNESKPEIKKDEVEKIAEDFSKLGIDSVSSFKKNLVKSFVQKSLKAVLISK